MYRPKKNRDRVLHKLAVMRQRIVELEREEARHRQTEALLAAEKRILEMIATGAPLPQVLDALVRTIEEQSPGSLCAICLLDTDGKTLRHGAAPSLPEEYNRALDGLAIGPRVGSCGTAAYRKEPVIVADIAVDPLWQEYRKLALRHGLRACWSTPIFSSQGEVLGTFAIYYRKPRYPDPHSRELIEMSTHLASIAIENARLQSATLRRAQQLSTLNQLSQTLTAVLHPQQVAQEILAAVQLLIPGAAGRLFELDADGKTVHLVASIGLRNPQGGLKRSFRLNEGLTGVAFATRQPVVSPDLARDHRLINKAWVAEEGLVSGIILPLCYREQLYGSLAIATRSPHHFDAEEITVLQSFANQAAIAFANAKLYATLEQRLDRLQTLTRLNRLITSSLDMGAVLHEIAQAAATLMQTPAVAFWLAHEARQTLELRAFSDAHIGEDIPIRTLRFDQGFAGWVATHRQPLHVADVLADSRIVARDWWQAHQLTSLLAIPVLHEDTLLAVLVLLGRQPFYLSPEDHRLLDSFVIQAALAIRNAQLFQEMQEQQQKLSAANAELRKEIAERKKVEAERERLHEQLLQAQKMKSLGTLASGIAHDFNNVLAMIMNATELLRLHAEDHPYLSRYAEMIASATERGAEITRQILLFARPDSAQLRPLSLSQLAAEVCQLLRHSFPKNITIETVWEGDNDFILADWSHLHQVLLNLALNARDAMPDGGTLTIRVDRERGENLRTRFPESGPEEYVAVHVSDTGVGMDEATRAHIFDPFFSTKERGKGTGLGLAIVYGIVQNHRGFIDVQSTPGQGTTVTLYFPATSPPARSVPPPEEAEQGRSGGTETILVVEDEEAIRETLQEILSSAGYTVLTAANGMEALDQYQRHQQDIALVITDLHMPSMGGKELMKRLQEIQPTLKVMFATGSLDHCSPSAVLEDGANAVITKPFRIQELLTTIRKTLEDRPVSYLEGEEA